jgi:hypothetical protein
LEENNFLYIEVYFSSKNVLNVPTQKCAEYANLVHGLQLVCSCGDDVVKELMQSRLHDAFWA